MESLPKSVSVSEFLKTEDWEKGKRRYFNKLLIIP
jgi:hypothetical protein